MAQSPWPVLVQLGATSLVDEGTPQVFDSIQELVEPTGVMFAGHGFNPELIDRGMIWSGHGPRESNQSRGGYFGKVNDGYYRNLRVGSPQVREPEFAAMDAIAVVGAEAAARNLGFHIYILESAGTGGTQRNVPGWTSILEIDVDGRRAKLPCVNHPDYRAWKLALLEDLYSSYDFASLLWGVERWGPLHQVMVGESPACFCEHCRRAGESAGLSWPSLVKGYRALRDAVARARAGEARMVSLLRILMQNPEILAWESRWTESYLGLHRELYGAAKWLAPERSFGLGLWHYYFIDPLLQAEWDMAEFSASADYIRPILYHLPEGPRIKRYLGTLSATTGMSQEIMWAAMADMLGLDLPPIDAFASTGLPASYVGQGIETVRRAAKPGTPILAGLGVDIYDPDLSVRMQPADAEAAVRAAWEAKADGITVSRNYAEMQLPNLEAVGRALKAIRAA